MNIKYKIIARLKRAPFPYLLLKRIQNRVLNQKTGRDPSRESIRWAPVEKDTDIVIEGYPRSANTYAVVAFRFAQKEELKIGYRLHAPNQLIDAARRGIPAVALIRDPKDAVLSWVIHHPELDISSALQGYLDFYEPLLPYQDKFIFADFKDVVSHFDKVTTRVNEKFGTSFTIFEQNEENVEKCFALIDDYYNEALGGKAIDNVVARPSEERKTKKAAVASKYDGKDFASLRERATELYETFTR